MKLNKIYVLILALFISISSCLAAKLPVNIQQHINENFPTTRIRIDGLIVLPDGTRYLPLFPALEDKNATFGVKKTVPKNIQVKNKPDIIVYNNNFVLVKLIPKPNGAIGIAEYPDYPLELRTGTLPQDLVVPHGFVLPEELKVILGNLEAPLIPSNINSAINQKVTDNMLQFVSSTNNKNFITTASKTKQPSVSATPAVLRTPKVQVPLALKNKIYLITNTESEKISILPATSSEPRFVLNLNTFATDIKATNDGRHVLIIRSNNKYLDVVDIKEEEILKQIDLGVQPSEILVSDNKYVYVASREDKSIFIINLDTFKITQKMKVNGAPEKLFLSEDNANLFYYDSISANLYYVEPKGKFVSYFVGNFPNAAKFIYAKNNVYALLRTRNELQVKTFSAQELKPKSTKSELKTISTQFKGEKKLDLKTDSKVPKIENIKLGDNDLINFQERPDSKDFLSIKTSVKPVDMINYADKLFVLCAKNNELNIINLTDNTPKSSIKLPIGGFSRKLTPIEHSNLMLITNAAERKYLIFDMDKEKVLQTVDISIPVENILILKDY